MSGRGLRGGGGFFEPPFDLRHVHTRLLRLAFELLEGDARKRDVIHFRNGCLVSRGESYPLSGVMLYSMATV